MCILHYKLSALVVHYGLSKILLSGELLVEVLEIVAYFRLVRRFKLFAQEFFRIEASEELMRKHFLQVALGAQALLLVLIQQLLYQISRDRGNFNTVFHLVGEGNGAFLDQEVHSVLVTMEEGWDTN